MQPAFIRLLDNLRKQMETSDWKGDYEQTLVWAGSVSEAEKQQVMALQQQLQTAPPEQVDDLERSLAALPAPVPYYVLHLSRGDRQVSLDIWELCYQICFQDYVADGAENPLVDIDTSLLDDTGDVDWNRLEDKTRQIVESRFARLSA